MTDKTSAELEHEAELARAKVSSTAESIRAKMTPGQLIDEFSGLFTSGDSSSMLATLRSQVGANPLPVALVGVGLTWLMAGQFSAQPTVVKSAAAPWQNARPGTVYDDTEIDAQTSNGSGLEVSETLSGMMDKAKSVVGDAVEGARTGMSDAARNVTDTAMNYGGSAGEIASKAATAASEILRQEPLVLAALGLAFGTAIGAMLPRTDFEDEQLGDTSDAVRGKVNELLNQGVEGVKDVAAQTYQAVKDEADKQGIASDPASLIDAVSDVARSAASQAEKSVRDKIGSVREDPYTT
jgi:ElaB/YqjD/DUF883 family membrane-anchored ribosome-binding protein